MSTAFGDRLRSASSNLQFQTLALGAAAGICSFAALQIGLYSFRRAGHAPPESIKEESVSPDAEQTPEVILYSSSLNVTDDAQESTTDTEAVFDSEDDKLRLLRRAEAVLARRTDRLLVVLDRCRSYSQEQDVLRTCECLGIQNVWLIGPHAEGASMSDDTIPGSPASFRSPSRAGRATVSDPACWLSLRTFQSGAECVSALREDQRVVWATDLSQTAERLDLVLRRCGARGGDCGIDGNGGGGEMPARLAVVFGGSEAEGVSRELLMAAHRRVYLPLHGMTESLDVSSTLSIVAHQIRGAWSADEQRLPHQEMQELREQWYMELAGEDEAAQALFSSHMESPPLAITDLRLPEPQRESIIAPARKVRQRREILGKHIAGARQPQTFGLSSSASTASLQPFSSTGETSVPPSPGLSLSTHRISFGDTSAQAVSSVVESQPEPRSAEEDELASLPQSGAAHEQRALGDGRLASSTLETDRLISVPDVANGPAMQQAGKPATVIQPRQRPWLTQPQ